MYEALPLDVKRPNVREVLVRCSGLRDDGSTCKKVLLAVAFPKGERVPQSRITLVAVCRRCGARNMYRLADVAEALTQ